MAVNKEKIMQETLNAIKAKIPGMTIDKYKNYGKSIEVETISTGSLALDNILGGGAAKGRLFNLVGHTSSGKTTVALTIIAEEQRKNPEANILYVDAENSLDISYAKSLGVNVDEIVICQPDCGEDGYEAADMFLASGIADIIVIDSVAAMIPRAILMGELGEQAQIGVGARLDTQGIGRLFAKANKTGTTVIVINQWVEGVKINAFATGDKVSGNKYQPGGQYLPFYMTHIVEISRVGQLVENGEVVSNQIRAYTRKNKIAAPYRTADFYITFGEGLDLVQEAIDLGLQVGEVVKEGRSIFKVKGAERGYNGRQTFVRYLKENRDVLDQLREAINLKIKDTQADLKINPDNSEADPASE